MKLMHYTVPSESDKTKMYQVSVTKDGIWSCSCPHFLMRGNQVVVCKHILKTMREIKKAASGGEREAAEQN